MIIYVSHGADNDPDWFVVEPQRGTRQSMANTPITTEMAVESLLEAGRTVYRVEADLPDGWLKGFPQPTQVIDLLRIRRT